MARSSSSESVRLTLPTKSSVDVLLIVGNEVCDDADVNDEHVVVHGDAGDVCSNSV